MAVFITKCSRCYHEGQVKVHLGQVRKNVGLFYKVGQFITKSRWYLTVYQILQSGPCTMFTLLIFMTLLLRHLQLCVQAVIFCLMRHPNKILLSVNDHILHTFSFVKFRNVKIKLRKFFNDHHIILNAYCFTMFYIQNHLLIL